MKHLPLSLVVLLILLLGPYVAVQMCPDSVTQEGGFWPPGGPRPNGDYELFTPGMPQGLFRGQPLPLGSPDPLFRVSLLANQFYFSPIAFVRYKLTGQGKYKYL